MKQKRILLLGMAFALTPFLTKVEAQSELQKQNRVRIMTYNVHNAVGMDGRKDVERLARIMRQSQADVVAVQEVDSATARSNGRYILGELAAEGLFYPTFAPAINFGGGKYGIGILSKEKPLSVRRVALPGREEARMLLVAEFDRYVVGCTHLSLTEADCMASADIILNEAARCTKPFILAGDWNAKPESPFVKKISESFRILNNTKTFTCPADKPDQTIDYIAVYKATGDDLVKKGISVREEKVASDHRPVVAQLQFKMPAEKLLYGEPYLQNPTPDGITVMFQTNAVCHSWVEYGTDKNNLKRTRALAGGQEVCYDIENKVRLDSLEPGKTYYYRIVSQEIVDYQSYSKVFGHTVTTPFYSFTLPTAGTTDFTAIIMNDLHEHRPTIEALSKLAAGIPHDFVIFNGDCLPEPYDRQYAMYHIHLLSDKFGGTSKPIFFMRGNHEIRNAYSAGMPTLFDNPGGETYGAFSWGDTRFVLLDCGEDKVDSHWAYSGLNDFTQFRIDQVGFLKKELASKAFKKAKRHILIHHIPLWGNEDEYTPCHDLWSPLLKKASIDVNLCGHTHRYKIHPAGDKGNPFPVVIGGGPGEKNATLMVLQKKGKELTLRILDANGNEKDRLTF